MVYEVLSFEVPLLIALFRSLALRVDAFILTRLNNLGPAFFDMMGIVPVVDQN